MVKNNKKGISPVVATALLLVVAVVAVVGFQTWFNNYQSGLNSKVEQQSNAGSSLTVERLEATANGTIYIKNTAVTAVNVTSWKVMYSGATYCNDSYTTFNAAASNVTISTSIGACGTALVVGNAYDVALYTNSGVFSGKLIAR